MLGLGLNLVKTRPPLVAGFSPPDIADLQLWLDASQIVGLNDGDAVTTWADASGNGRSVTQPTASSRPLYKTNIQNGKPALLFDAVDDWLANTGATLTVKDGFTILAVVKPDNDVDTWDGIFSKLANDISFSFWQIQGLNIANSGVAFMVAEGNFAPQVWQSVVGTYDGTTAKVFRNNVQLASAAYSSALLTDNTGFYIGLESLGYPLMFFGGYMGEILIYNRKLTAAELLQLSGYVVAKWGTP